jgi:tetratricopeptide (TPR) repeat protein
MSDHRRKTLWAVWLLGAGVAAGAVWAAWPRARPRPAPSAEEALPPPPYAESRHLNTGPDARYIGTAACAECHKANHKSYLHTAHSRALSDVRPDDEPPDGSFEHKASGRSYRVYRKDGQLRHQELLRNEQDKEVARVDLPVRYLVGSGHFSRTYLVEVNGFLHESPITWYASRKGWGLSPGYDFPVHASFERPVGADCLACHAGRAEPVGDAFHRMTFREKAIGCENCHGPGSLHQERHRDGQAKVQGDDLTIVNPGKVPRPLQEAICANCHLSGPAAVTVRGRLPGDFRPGRPLTDYRVHYQLAGGRGDMTVVGHVEQLRLSACYQKSPGLTCVTCHDPHRDEEPKDRVAFYRDKCQACHAEKPCRLGAGERQKKADDCVACHMPRGDTDIPHIAFTHHRIGHHKPRPQAEPEGVPELVPLDDGGRLGVLDQRRNLALAYLEASRSPPYARYAAAFRERAKEGLQSVREKGLREGVTAQALAEIALAERDFYSAAALAREALKSADASPRLRGLALTALAMSEIQNGDDRAAVGALEEVVRTRRLGEDWLLLGETYLRLDQPKKALPALQESLAIRPFRPRAHDALSRAYRRLGDVAHADEHQETARWLTRHKQE